jgi:cytochrome c-type biogenesis protein CcmE
MSPGRKLTAGALLMATAIVYLAYIGAATSWQYYLSVDEAVADASHIQGKRIRVSGLVRAGSLTIDDDRQRATFVLAGKQCALHATCYCPMPDNLAEDIDVVVEGTLQADEIRGDKVVTRCASKYQPADRVDARDQRSAQEQPPSAGHRVR